ncbi:hypothetical protein BASA50_003287 [Batrachochytrium salamandrivorans]|uniref:Stress-response A/B barrel domain-containing protein n=1 Tax=Batrachochytrium salamandrivorans TaxID=1357716 RepID=A0ABQ8FJ06_9FUNG|nr:hypothetical protein BASA62_006080 [Batrachochytrium salamandrivorans]KAH6582402.1 hypothetical protein BASA60_001945 [Batrachochytrium salamandrivorans]KAH6582694.1 hypothetical protein BASA61_008401 [Batrachochytrium salamandrivorans]KAH6582695.1 hypothetical protein BASA61_008402 [Batrachochytrium salamandrivorans]KAH6599077.1 hypothetical protein BASA50_003287 [Batrachochytrium salamandrivorans]
MVVKHVVLFKFQEKTAPAVLSKLATNLSGLTCIPGVLHVAFGETFTTERSQGFSHVLITTLKDRAALAVYASNEKHVEVIKTSILPNVIPNGVLAMDIEDPSSSATSAL